jgi:hypothetical protein
MQPYAETEDSSLSDIEPEEVTDELLRVIRSPENALETPSKRSYRVNQEKSPRYSIGSGSPLLPRLKAQKLQQRFKEQQSNHNENESSDFHEQGPQEDTWGGLSSNDERDSDEAEPLQKTEIGRLEEALTRFQESMQNDHGDTVKWLLHDARTAAANRQPLFIDKVSPFASIQPAHIVSSGSIPNGFVITDMHSYVSSRAQLCSHLLIFPV